MKIIAHLTREATSAGTENGSAYTFVIAGRTVAATAHGQEEEKSETISEGDGNQGAGAGTGGHASGGEGGYREEEKAGEAQADTK